MASKKVIVSSFHSGSIFALYENRYDFDCVVSFDSHCDVRIGGYHQDVVREVSSNFALQQAMGRAAAHVMFSNTFENMDELLLVIPQICFESDTAWMNHDMQIDSHELALTPQRQREFLQHMWKIKILNSPPKYPLSEIKKFTNGKNPLFDIDVDYFGDLQDECYTPMLGAEKYDLGKLERTIKTIKKIRPDTITFSEATVKALEDRDSKTNYLLGRLEDMGYERDDFFIFDEDDEAKYYIKKVNDFQAHVREQTPSVSEVMNQANSDKTRNAVKEFFKEDLEY